LNTRNAVSRDHARIDPSQRRLGIFPSLSIISSDVTQKTMTPDAQKWDWTQCHRRMALPSNMGASIFEVFFHKVIINVSVGKDKSNLIP
jgi:hypothetical protein